MHKTRRRLTDRQIAALKPHPNRGYALPDPVLAGLYVRIRPSGTKSFTAVANNPRTKKQVWTTIGRCDLMPIDVARDRAREIIRRVRSGQEAVEPPPDTFESVAELWRQRHVVKNQLRSAKEIERLLRVHVYPAWKDRAFLDIRRSDVAALLDEIEDDHSPRQADYVLNVIRSVMNWFATRNDDYIPPIVRGMKRQKQDTRRDRVLTDDEIRTIWKQAEANGTFGAIIRLCIATAQRRTKIAAMRWQDITIDGEWTIPVEPREKGAGGTLVLPELALDIIRAQPRIGSSPYVFPGRSPRRKQKGPGQQKRAVVHGPFRGWSASKATFDSRLAGVAPWVLHDLRRTARSLMSRAGVSSEHAERVMGHVIRGVEGVYDRHSYWDEKRDALKRLAALIDGIVNPRENVVPMTKRSRQKPV
jgi:integrase